jgi:DNA-directed RNA polymerase subunit K/omega
MTDLFLEPKVLDFNADRYELILLTLRWARALKAKGSPEPMNELIEKALRDLVEKKITKEEIMANKVEEPQPAEEEEVAVAAPSLGESEEKEEESEEKKKTKKKKKKEK